MKTLTISHLTKVVKQKTLLDDVSFPFHLIISMLSLVTTVLAKRHYYAVF